MLRLSSMEDLIEECNQHGSWLITKVGFLELGLNEIYVWFLLHTNKI